MNEPLLAPPTRVAGGRISVRWRHLPATRILRSLALLACLATAAPRVDADEVASILRELRSAPHDKALLARLKAAIPSVTNRSDRCLPGVVYCLGCLAVGDEAEGLAVRAQAAGAFAGATPMELLHDGNVMEPCGLCGSGDAVVDCASCRGTGRCPKCRGSVRRGDGVSQMDCLTCLGSGACRTCGGAGATVQRCARCGGTGLVVSRSKCDAAYRTLLLSGIPDDTPTPKTRDVARAPDLPPDDPSEVARRFLRRTAANAVYVAAPTKDTDKVDAPRTGEPEAQKSSEYERARATRGGRGSAAAEIQGGDTEGGRQVAADRDAERQGNQALQRQTAAYQDHKEKARRLVVAYATVRCHLAAEKATVGTLIARAEQGDFHAFQQANQHMETARMLAAQDAELTDAFVQLSRADPTTFLAVIAEIASDSSLPEAVRNYCGSPRRR